MTAPGEFVPGNAADGKFGPRLRVADVVEHVPVHQLSAAEARAGAEQLGDVDLPLAVLRHAVHLVKPREVVQPEQRARVVLI